MEDAFLKDIVKFGASDPLHDAQSSSRRPRIDKVSDSLQLKHIQKSYNRQVVSVVSAISNNVNLYGSGVLIHELKWSQCDLEGYDWVLTDAHCCTTFDDGIQKALYSTVRIFGTDQSCSIYENVGDPLPLSKHLGMNGSCGTTLDEPNITFVVRPDDIFVYSPYFQDPSPHAGYDLALLHLPDVFFYCSRKSEERFATPRIWNPKQTPFSFSIVGFQEFTQITSLDGMQTQESFASSDQWEPSNWKDYYRFEFKEFSSMKRNGKLMAKYQNSTWHGISGGGLFFNSTKWREGNRSPTLVGCHNSGNSLDDTQRGTIIDNAVWDWIVCIQDENQTQCKDFLTAAIRGREKELSSFKGPRCYDAERIMQEYDHLLAMVLQKGNLDVISQLMIFFDKNRNWTFDKLSKDVNRVYPHSLGVNLLEYFRDIWTIPSEYSQIILAGACVTGGNLEILKKMVSLGCSVNKPFSALATVCRSTGDQQVEKVQYLLSAAADVNQIFQIEKMGRWGRSQTGNETVLKAALYHPNPDVIRLLIDADADVNLRAEHESKLTSLTPLRYLVSGGPHKQKDKIMIARMLLEAGAEINDGAMYSLLDHARNIGWDEMAELLMEFGAETSLDVDAMILRSRGDPKKLRDLLKEVERQNEQMKTLVNNFGGTSLLEMFEKRYTHFQH